MAETDVISLAGAIGLYVVGDLSEGGSSQVRALIQGTAIDQLYGWSLVRRIRDSIQKGRLYSRVLIVARGKRVLRSLHQLGVSCLIRTVPTLDDAMKALQGQAS